MTEKVEGGDNWAYQGGADNETQTTEFYIFFVINYIILLLYIINPQEKSHNLRE